jgi:hypothetical protein
MRSSYVCDVVTKLRSSIEGCDATCALRIAQQVNDGTASLLGIANRCFRCELDVKFLLRT